MRFSAMFDRNHDFRIDFREFQQLWTQMLMWQHSFTVYDTNRSGAINFTELRNALWGSGYRVSGKWFLQLGVTWALEGH